MTELTVIMPVFNGEEYLREAIESILQQTFINFRFLIINDASTDNSQEIINEYKERDKRIESIKNSKNLGVSKSRNMGLDWADTEYIAFMDADDKALPNRFKKQIDYLKMHPDIGLCGCWFTFMGDKKKTIDHNSAHDQIKIDFLSHCPVQTSTVMFRRSCLGAVRFDEEFVVGEDYLFFSQLIAKTKFYNLPESLLYYRWHAKNISHTEKERFGQANDKVKISQLEHLGILSNDKDLQYYINAVSLKKGQSKEAVVHTVHAAKRLRDLNILHNYFDQELFEDHLNKTVVRTIRNAKDYDKLFYNYIKRDSGFYRFLPIPDKIMLYLKSNL